MSKKISHIFEFQRSKVCEKMLTTVKQIINEIANDIK
jgi:hypothetical protein